MSETKTGRETDSPRKGRGSRRTFDPHMRVNGTRERDTRRYVGAVERNEETVELSREFAGVLARLNERSRELWTTRLQQAPSPGDPQDWRGRVSSRMRSDWAHASKAHKRDVRRESLNRAARAVSN